MGYLVEPQSRGEKKKRDSLTEVSFHNLLEQLTELREVLYYQHSFIKKDANQEKPKGEISKMTSEKILCPLLKEGECITLCFCFLGLQLWHMEVPRLGVELEL